MLSCRSYNAFNASRCIFCPSSSGSPLKLGGRNDLSSGEGCGAGASEGGRSTSVRSAAICDSVSKSSKMPNLSTSLSQIEIFTKKSHKA